MICMAMACMVCGLFVDVDDMNFNCSRRKFSSFEAYTSSKLAQVIYADIYISCVFDSVSYIYLYKTCSMPHSSPK